MLPRRPYFFESIGNGAGHACRSILTAKARRAQSSIQSTLRALCVFAVNHYHGLAVGCGAGLIEGVGLDWAARGRSDELSPLPIGRSIAASRGCLQVDE